MGCINTKRAKKNINSDVDKKKTWKNTISSFIFKKKKNRIAPEPENAKQLEESNRNEKEREIVLGQLEEENISAKINRGGISYSWHPMDANDKDRPNKPVLPRRLKEKGARPSNSIGTNFNSEEKKLVADILRQESLEQKGRLAKVSDERKIMAQARREAAQQMKNRETELKLKTREEKLKHAREVREKMIRDQSCNEYEKQQQAKYRRDNKIKEKQCKVESKEKAFQEKKKEMTFEERRKYLMNKYTNTKMTEDNGLPGVDV